MSGLRGGWYVNLASAAERREHMERLRARWRLPIERFDALTPATTPVELAARLSPRGNFSAGEHGCLASHLALLERVARAEAGWWLVLEDDVDLAADPADVVEALRGCPTTPHVVRLENVPKCASLRVWRQGAFQFLRPLVVPNSSAGYLVTPEGAAALLARAWEVARPADQFLRAAGRDGVDMLVCSPPPVAHDLLPSSIGEAHGRPRREGPPFRGGGPSLSREIAVARRFGLGGYASVLALHALMKARGVRRDDERRYVADAPARRS